MAPSRYYADSRSHFGQELVSTCRKILKRRLIGQDAGTSMLGHAGSSADRPTLLCQPDDIIIAADARADVGLLARARRA